MSNKILGSVIAKVRTDVCGQVADWREEDLDVRAGDKLRVHSSSVFEESATKQTFRAGGGVSVPQLPGEPRVHSATHMPKRSATPGKYHTGSTAALLMLISTPGSAVLGVPSALTSG